MTDAKEPSPSKTIRGRAVTANSRIMSDFISPTVTTMTPIAKRIHDVSLVSLAHNVASRVSKSHDSYQKFSASLLKNKTLLVPTRLAIKRHRATFKSPLLNYEPVKSERFQFELGSLENSLPPNEKDFHRTTTSPELIRIKSTSNRTTSFRAETPHTQPTDISVVYKEKPTSNHPVTGHLIVPNTEDSGSPSPCSYVLPRKSCREKNAPAYSFGTRCLVERRGGSRTSWYKQWFANSDPFTTKVDFNREISWPTPFHYQVEQPLGVQPNKLTFPTWSMAARLEAGDSTIISGYTPAPDAYDTATAFRKLTAKSTQITIKSRTRGTQMSLNQSTDITPGPGAHDNNKFLSNRRSSPKHSFGKRPPISLGQDPYIYVLPSIRT